MHQQTLLNEAARGGDGHEVRLVGHQQMVIFKDHTGLHGQCGFVSQMAVVVQALPGLANLFGRRGLSAVVQHQALLQALGPFLA